MLSICMVNKFILALYRSISSGFSMASSARAYGVQLTHLKLHAVIYECKNRCSKMSNLRSSTIKTN